MSMPVRIETVSRAYPPYVFNHDSAIQAIGRDAIEKIVNAAAEEPLDTETVAALGEALAVDAFARERAGSHMPTQFPQSEGTVVKTNSYGPWSPRRTMVYAAATLFSAGMHYAPAIPAVDWALLPATYVSEQTQKLTRCIVGKAFDFTTDPTDECFMPDLAVESGARLMEVNELELYGTPNHDPRMIGSLSEELDGADASPLYRDYIRPEQPR